MLATYKYMGYNMIQANKIKPLNNDMTNVVQIQRSYAASAYLKCHGVMICRQDIHALRIASAGLHGLPVPLLYKLTQASLEEVSQVEMVLCRAVQHIS